MNDHGVTGNGHPFFIMTDAAFVSLRRGRDLPVNNGFSKLSVGIDVLKWEIQTKGSPASDA
jgi:hypothetical protein